MSFQIAYNTTILNEQPFLVIFGPVNDFWVGQEDNGTSKNISGLKNSTNIG